jgi:hypothetical protein
MRVEQSIAIGELSRRTGVNIETIRYFERVGVLTTPPRTSGGRRAAGIWGRSRPRPWIHPSRARTRFHPGRGARDPITWRSRAGVML